MHAVCSNQILWLQVDQRLQTKVFLAGLSVSLADLVMFATLYRALVGFAATLSMCSWYSVHQSKLYQCRRPTFLVHKEVIDTQTSSGGLTSCSTLSTLQATTKG